MHRCEWSRVVAYCECSSFSVILLATESIVTAHSNNTQVELECEMTLFIRPDEDLQWFRGSEMIVSETNRHTVSYHNGSAEVVANGNTFNISSLVSVLTISNPQLSDSGTYTCRILGTEQSADVQLSLEGVFPAAFTPSVTVTATPTQSATPMDPGAALPTAEIVAITVVMGVVVFTMITVTVITIIIVVVKRKKGLKATVNEAYGVHLHHHGTTAPSNDIENTSTDYYINEGLGPKQPTSEEEYSYAFPGPHIQQKSAY